MTHSFTILFPRLIGTIYHFPPRCTYISIFKTGEVHRRHWRQINALAVLTFGESTFSTSVYPLYRLVKVISVADFLENLDALGILYFMGTAFFKVTIQMYGVIRGIQQLLYLRDSRVLVLPTAAIVLFLGNNLSRSTSEHWSSSKSLGNLGLLPLIVFPSLLLIVACIRKQISITQMKKSDDR